MHSDVKRFSMVKIASFGGMMEEFFAGLVLNLRWADIREQSWRIILTG
jgi:hypothetical protein